MGWAALGRCFGTEADALGYVCGFEHPYAMAGSVVSCTSTGAGVLNLETCNGAGCTSAVVATTLAPCDTLDWLQYYPASLSIADAGAIGTAIAASWCAAWAFKALLRTLKDRDDGD